MRYSCSLFAGGLTVVKVVMSLFLVSTLSGFTGLVETIGSTTANGLS